MEEKKLIKYGTDDFTVSINKNEKTEDWHCDWSCKIVLEDGKVLWANLYNKNDNWMAGKIKVDETKPVEKKEEVKKIVDDEIPF
jgi:hypothetical protein|tara:strand:- start:470 stop:721 length:252 start_codon:yes stop_codon:yes gene_type:complete